KNGIPNKPVASELMNYKSPPEIRWYKSHGEQYHAKFMMHDNGEDSTLILGSSNFTRRNLKDLNLETDLVIKAKSDSEEMISMNDKRRVGKECISRRWAYRCKKTRWLEKSL